MALSPSALRQRNWTLGLLTGLGLALLYRRQISAQVARISVPLAQATGGAINVTIPASDVPRATRFVWPIHKGGPGNHGLSVTFMDPQYHDGTYGAAVKGFWHTGIDLNGPGGGNTDVGWPVYAMTDGVVEFAGVGGATWGPIILLRHELTDGRTIRSRYGHLGNLRVKTGDVVTAGQQIAAIGRPSDWGATFTAHNHFDVLHKRPFRANWWPARNGPQSEVTAYALDPLAFLLSVRAGEA
jgi:murein DD-endopeptidase MepM/ murein hydrolase activator NlpD